MATVAPVKVANKFNTNPFDPPTAFRGACIWKTSAYIDIAIVNSHRGIGMAIDRADFPEITQHLYICIL